MSPRHWSGFSYLNSHPRRTMAARTPGSRSRYVLFALCFLLTSACSSKKPEPTRPLNLVLVTIDTLRPDHLACYGNTKIQTPNLDKLSQRGVLFQNAVTHTPLTAPSHASMFTGLYPTVHKVRDTGGFYLQPTSTTLASILQQQGYDTAAFVGASVLKKSFGFNRGFSVYDDDMPKPAPGTPVEFPERRAAEVVDRAVGWLDSRTTKPFFLWVHVFDPHFPYKPPSPFSNTYDGEIAYTDQQLGRVFDSIARKSPKDTIVAVLSDHGESLSDHGEYTHGVYLYDSTLRIAFLLAGPRVPSGMRVTQQARAVDVLPTLLDLVGGQPPSGIQGTTLTPTFTGKDPAPWSYIETLYPKINMGWTELKGMRSNRWKYIRAPKPELYDLLNDPSELRNVISSHPAEREQAEAQLQTISGGQSEEKVQTAAVDQHTLQQLKSLGYLGGSSQQSYTLTGKGIDPKDRAPVLKLLFDAMSPGTVPSQRIAMLQEALALDKANPSIYYHLGQEYANAQRNKEAFQLYQHAIREGIRTAWLFSRLGHLNLQGGNREDAIASFERAAQLNPSDYESMSDLALAYLESDRVGDAERVLKWSLTTSNDYAPTYNALGLVAIRKEDKPGARTNFEKAVQLDPNLLEAQLNLGKISKMMGDTARARACFEAFLAKASPSEYADLIPRIRQELADLK